MSQHHSFDTELAQIYGIDCAIMIHHFSHWISINQKLKRNFREGRTWTYQTIDEIAAHFPYFSNAQVTDIIEKLVNGKSRRSKSDKLDFNPVLMKGNFNKSSYDRTVWYAFCEEPKCILANAKMDKGECQNGFEQMPKCISTYSKDICLNKDINTPEAGISPAKAVVSSEKQPILEEHGKFVKLSREEYQKLCSQFSERTVQDLIERINDYLASTGCKPYKDYSATIRNWQRRSKEKGSPQKTYSSNQKIDRRDKDQHGNPVQIDVPDSWRD